MNKYSEILKIIPSYLEAASSKVQEIYENLNSPDESLYSNDRCYPLNGIGVVRIPHWLGTFFQENDIVPELGGVDLPFYVDKGKSQTIAVFGINPLRNNRDWNGRGAKNVSNSFLLSSAWAKHAGYCQLPNKQLFSSLEGNFNLYLSDIQKWFFKTPDGKPSHEIAAFSNLNIHRQIVDKEIEIIKPDFILLLGRQAAELFDIPLIGLMNSPIEIIENFGSRFIIIPHTSSRISDNHRIQYAAANAFEHHGASIGRDYASLITKLIAQHLK